MKKILTAIVCLISVASAVAESGQFENLSGGIVTTTTNDYGNSKYSITNVTYSSRVTSSNVSFMVLLRCRLNRHQSTQIASSRCHSTA